ncbi:MAG: hypothetical protein QOJ88_1592 [Pyrinomonadaceae bacterium]|nr:hypothetical protein [Pyrinomonadaceae bacterium]
MKPNARKTSQRKIHTGSAGAGGENIPLYSRVLSARPLNSFGVLIALLCLAAGLSVLVFGPPAAQASAPNAGAINLTSAPLNWKGTGTAGGALGDPLLGQITSEDMCIEGTSCDTFTLTIGGTPADWINAKKLVHVHLGWTVPTQDFDLYIHRGDLNGPIVADSGNGATTGILTSEDADLDPSSPSVGTGTFAVHVVYWAATSADQYNATASVENAPAPPPPGPSPTPVTEPAGTPRFYNYQAPSGVADDAGEPSIGVNWKSEKINGGIPDGGGVTYYGGFLPYMLRAHFNDTFTPAKIAWEKKALTVATAPRLLGDPILFTDNQTGRTFVSQEMGLTPAGSTMEYSDNDGDTFTPSEGSGAPSGIDHQTVAGGPFHAPVPTGASPLYPNGVWYCSQAIADAVCSISFDGGTTFGPAVPMYSIADCGGIHGHLKIGPDGTAYVPNVSCGANQAVVVSEDNGITWNIRKLPQSAASDRDPSVAVGRDNTLYFSYQNADGHSRVAVSRDKGLTWERDTDIGAQLGIRNSLFHAAVAGDGDRAAVAFFGTTTGGADYDQPAFTGVWYLYIATTFDRGQTWWTQNATPNDPIQRGGICTTGPCRNLLDFFGADVDKEGRVLVGYDDGCISRACITGQKSYGLPAINDFIAKAVIARQTGGKRMFAAYDPPAGPVAEPPVRPLPAGAGISCDGLVATDATGDANNPEAPLTGSPDNYDITALNFAVSADRQSLVSTITLKNFSTIPAPATAGGYYRAVWATGQKTADGSPKYYATQVTTDPTGSVYEFGQYDPGGSAFVGSTTTTTGATVEGPNGTLSVNVPLSALGNPAIPVSSMATLPAVIEPFAIVFAHVEAASFLAAVERAPDYGFFGASWAVCLPPPPPTVECLDDSDSRISYSDGWHLVNATNASGGHFRFHTGKSPNHSASLTFNVAAGKTGKLTYYYGTSTKGGTADVVLDGVSKPVTYQGASGGMKDPVFGAKLEFANLAAGAHTLVITNMNDAVYVDGFCLESSSTTSQPTSGPGATMSSSNNLAAGKEVLSTLPINTSATAISVVAASSNNLPIKLALISPSGSVVQVVDSINGVAVINAPVTQAGNYVIKTVNLNLGPVQVWTLATPTVKR